MDPSKFSSLLECPICSHIPLTDILQCINGHVICSKCFIKLRPLHEPPCCPQGRCDYDDPPSRNRMMEEMVAKAEHLVFSCQNDGKGCGFKGTREALAKHNENCDLELLKCPLSPCREKFSKKKLVRHIKSHKLDWESSFTGSFEIRDPGEFLNSQFCYKGVVQDGRKFVICSKTSEKTNLRCIWVQSLEEDLSIAGEYVSEIDLRGAGSSEHSILCDSDRVYSLADKQRKIVSDCFHVANRQFERLWRDERWPSLSGEVPRLRVTLRKEKQSLAVPFIAMMAIGLWLINRNK